MPQNNTPPGLRGFILQSGVFAPSPEKRVVDRPPHSKIQVSNDSRLTIDIPPSIRTRTGDYFVEVHLRAIGFAAFLASLVQQQFH